jgi:hypothetical protein
MTIVALILLVLAFLLFVLSGFGIVGSPRWNLVALGLAAWVLSLLLNGVGAVR